MGLPGSGKSTLAKQLTEKIDNTTWFNADEVRRRFNDWDFSPEGRLRQARRMGELARIVQTDHVICDFVCPTPETFSAFCEMCQPDFVVWMDTVEKSRFENTNAVFVPPAQYDVRVTAFNPTWPIMIADHILGVNKIPKWDNRKPTVQMLGRYQPWHKGHRAVFLQAIQKADQVAIMVRDCLNWNDSNPFDVNQVVKNINADLEAEFYGRYTVIPVPNILEIVYGRDVGYKITQIEVDAATAAISATDIRKSMGLK